LSATILIVEDSPTVLRMASAALEDGGFRVLTATDGEAALQLVKREKPDLIVLDIILPKINGFQVCRHLKNDPASRHIKILLLSSKSGESDRYWGLRQGADDYLTKPFEPEGLVSTVTRLLNRPAGADSDPARVPGVPVASPPKRS